MVCTQNSNGPRLARFWWQATRQKKDIKYTEEASRFRVEKSGDF